MVLVVEVVVAFAVVAGVAVNRLPRARAHRGEGSKSPNKSGGMGDGHEGSPIACTASWNRFRSRPSPPRLEKIGSAKTFGSSSVLCSRGSQTTS